MSQSQSQLVCKPQEDYYTPDTSQEQSSDANQCIEPAATQPTGNQAACANLPSAQLTLSNLAPVTVPIVVPGAVAKATVSLGGQLTAKEKCSSNPVTVGNAGVSAAGAGTTASAGAGGVNTAQLSSTLAGVTSSVQVSLNGGAPQITVGSAGTFGAQQTSVEVLPTGAVKTTYQVTARDVKLERNGIDISGNISIGLEVIIQPTPRAPWYQRAWQWVKNTARSFADWVSEHKKEIMVGVGVAALAVGAAILIVGTGGAAAPALALGT